MGKSDDLQNLEAPGFLSEEKVAISALEKLAKGNSEYNEDGIINIWVYKFMAKKQNDASQ